MDERELTPNELFMSLHGTLMALVTALHRSKVLPEQAFLEQMSASADALRSEMAPRAAQLVQCYAETLRVEWQHEPSSG